MALVISMVYHTVRSAAGQGWEFFKPFYGKLRLALTHSKRWPAGRRLLGFLQRTEHELTRAEDYEHLLALAKHEVPLHAVSDMLVQ